MSTGDNAVRHVRKFCPILCFGSGTGCFHTRRCENARRGHGDAPDKYGSLWDLSIGHSVQEPVRYILSRSVELEQTAEMIQHGNGKITVHSKELWVFLLVIHRR